MLTSCQHIRRLGGKRCAQWTSSGRTTALLPVTISVARVLNPDDKDDWVNFYVNIFVDRDMLVRHFGHGVGHLKHHGNNDTSDSESEAMEVDSDSDSEIYNDSDSESDDTEEPESEGGPMVNNDDSSDGDDEDIESGSSCDSEDDDGGYASL